MYMWIQHFLFARTARVKLDGILSKNVCLREGVPQGGVLSPTLFWSTSVISSPLYQRGSLTHYMQATWQSGMRLNTPPLQPTGSKKPSVISASGHWTGASRWIPVKQTAPSSPFPHQKNRSNYGWTVRSCPDRQPHLPWCEAGHTTYLEATDREDRDKQSAETSPDEKARRNFLGCRLINSD